MKRNADTITTSHQERKHKKTRTTSTKKTRIKPHRRHRDSRSPSTSTSPPPVRQKSSKNVEGRKRDKKKSERKGRGKARRKRRDSSVSSYSSEWTSSRSCSTCGSNGEFRRSRSPVARKSRKGKSRGRSREKRKGGSRHRSLSCSSCGGSSRSERSGRSARSRRSREPRVEKRKGGSRYRSLSCSSCSGSSRSKHNGRSGGRGRSRKPSEERFLDVEPPKRLKSVLEVSGKSREEDLRVGRDDYEEGDKIIQAYDDFDPLRIDNVDDRYDGSRQRQLEEDVRKDVSFTDDGTCLNKRERILDKSDEKLPMDGNDASREHSVEKKGEHFDSLEANDLELLLRQKALENLKRFRGAQSVNAKKNTCREHESSKIMSSKDNVHATDAKDAMRSGDSKLASSQEYQRSVSGLNQPTELTVKSTIYVHPDKVAPAHVNSRRKDHETSNTFFKPGPGVTSEDTRIKGQLKHTEDSSSRTYKPGPGVTGEDTRIKGQLKHTENSSSRSPMPKSQINAEIEKIDVTEPKSSMDDNVTKADVEPASGVSAPLSIKNAVKLKDEDTGSEFQQKTFSRMQGGELVQVNYTVRIPKRPPALARRKLER